MCSRVGNYIKIFQSQSDIKGIKNKRKHDLNLKFCASHILITIRKMYYDYINKINDSHSL